MSIPGWFREEMQKTQIIMLQQSVRRHAQR